MSTLDANASERRAAVAAAPRAWNLTNAGVIMAVHEQGEMTLIVCSSRTSQSWAWALRSVQCLRDKNDVQAEIALFVWLERFVATGNADYGPDPSCTEILFRRDDTDWTVVPVTFEFPVCIECDVIKIACPV